jgi:hypothetical protein
MTCRNAGSMFLVERVSDNRNLLTHNRVLDCRSNGDQRILIFDARDGAHSRRVYGRRAKRFPYARIPEKLHLTLRIGSTYAVGGGLLTRTGYGERNRRRTFGRGHVVATPEPNTPGTDRRQGIH